MKGEGRMWRKKVQVEGRMEKVEGRKWRGDVVRGGGCDGKRCILANPGNRNKGKGNGAGLA